MGKHKGIKLVAYLPISKTTLLDLGGQNDLGGVNFLRFNNEHFAIHQGYVGVDVTFDVFGRGFKYQGEFEVPTKGTVTKVEVSVGGSLGLVVSKLNLPALDAIDMYLKDDPFAGFAKLLKGNDRIIGSPYDDPSIWGGKGDDYLFGHLGWDTLDGGPGNDINDGGGGNDQLIDTKGENVFQFSTPFQTGDANLNFNWDIVRKLRGRDEIYLKFDLFDAAGMSVSKSELTFEDHAVDGNDFFIWTGKTFYYDPDANGAGLATPIFTTLNDAKLTHKMIEIGYDGY